MALRTLRCRSNPLAIPQPSFMKAPVLPTAAQAWGKFCWM